ncbi:hypothetical protein [Bradyrhizobium sp. 2S1]|uniref:hypothetical protein n=1 Tax=Bradyrhizobium sp. 2S1 TaxID=1404429 RepID=UPI001409AF39|nr:hypothetical protein [Bradyrhizobium sp. 2S1]MCK7665754.1 hypothetical protein [Bradyrhizobium sp. 2S1]
MGKAGKTSKGADKPSKKSDEKSRAPPPPAAPPDDEYDEDGDIATPKIDRYGNDDEPL